MKNKTRETMLAELCNIRKGQTVNKTKNKSENSVPYLLIDTLRGEDPKFYTEDEKYTEARPDDILIVGDGANSGLVGTGLRGAVGSTIVRVRIEEKDKLTKDYLSFFLKSKFGILNKDVKGTGIPHLKTKRMLQMKIRLPPLEKQKQIVEEIEKHLSRLEEGIKNLKSVKKKVDIYRKAVLKAAFEVKGNNVYWKEVQLKNVLDYEQPNKYRIEGEIKKDKKSGTPIVTANKSFIRGYTEEKKGIYKNIPAIIFDDFTTNTKLVNFPFKVKSSAMKILNTENKNIDLKFIYYQMQNKKINASTHKRYYISIYQKLNFIFPYNKKEEISLEKQKQIVEEIESKFSVIDKIEEIVDKNLKKAERLKKSILKSAFEGELI